MGPLLGLAQLILRAAGDDVLLKIDVMLQRFLQCQRLGLAVDNGKHNHAEGGLHLRVAEQLVEHHLRGGLALYGDHNPHTCAVGMVLHIADALDALILDQVGNGFNQARLVHLVGQLGDNDVITPVLFLLNLGPGPHNNTPAPGGVCRPDAAAPHDDGAGGEIRPFDVLHQLLKGGVWVVDERTHAVDDLTHIMRRNIRRHADRDARGAVDQQVGEVAGQGGGFLEAVVVVRGKIDRVLINIQQHLLGKAAHAALSITVGSRRVAVHRAEVAVAVHQHIAHGKVLCQAHQCVVDRRVAVRMVPAQHRSDGVRAFTVGLVGVEVVFIHGVEDAPVHRLQAVPHIRQGARHNNRHGVVQKGFFNLLFQVYVDDLIVFVLPLILCIFQIVSRNVIHLSDSLLTKFFSHCRGKPPAQQGRLGLCQRALRHKMAFLLACIEQKHLLVLISPKKQVIVEMRLIAAGLYLNGMVRKQQILRNHPLFVRVIVGAGGAADKIGHQGILPAAEQHAEQHQQAVRNSLYIAGAAPQRPKQNAEQHQGNTADAQCQRLTGTARGMAGRRLIVAVILPGGQVACAQFFYYRFTFFHVALLPV